MAIKITDDCINCGSCELKCPNMAIYEGSREWSFSNVNNGNRYRKNTGEIVGATDPQPPVSDSVYYIVPEKCTECVGFHDEPQCISVCPVDCCVPDPANAESKNELASKKERVKV